MAKRKPLAWWVIPGVVAASVTALGALGTVIVKGAAYITLPEKVEAGERKNSEQDEALSKLTAIQETWQNIYQQQQQQPQYQNLPNPLPRTEGLREWDDTNQTFWCCPQSDRDACYTQQQWGRCP